MQQPRQEVAPYVPAERSLPEFTLKAILLGAVLAVVLGAANAYLGLFAGMTVSASIPAAVISMALLRLFRESNILENNLVQTAASAGESLAAGVIFTLPAMILLGAWEGFNYWEVTMIAGLGGLLGVLFTIPLRRALIVEEPLRFPEGVATAEVLKVGDTGGSQVKYIAWSALIGALFKLGSTGMRLWGETAAAARYVGGSIAYIGTNLSPALVGVGFIVGLNIATLIFLGGILNWWAAIPFVAQTQGIDLAASPVDAANQIWSAQTRYLGVGAMVVGGLWALISLRKSVFAGVQASITAYRSMRDENAERLPRTEQDTPIAWVGTALALSSIPLFFVFLYVTSDLGIALFMAITMLVASFLFSAVAGYMSGLVGSSNNPISGVTIATILTAALLLVALGADAHLGPAAAILIGAVVACAAAIAGDNLQDLKAGYVLGATPYKQQGMQVLGVTAAALVMAPILTLILKAYGIGGATGLAAPQATLMAAVAEGVFGGDLPRGMILAGGVIAVLVIALDEWLRHRGTTFRTPVLAVAVGLYLPLELETPIFLGGILAWLAARAMRRRGASEEERTAGERHGLLFSAGLITGEALVGILLAIPIVLLSDREALAFWGVHERMLPGLVLLALVCWLLYRVGSPRRVT